MILWSNMKKNHQMSQLIILWYLSRRRPAKAQANLRIHAVSPEPSLFAHMKYGSWRRVRTKIRHLAQLDGCACAFEEWVHGGRRVPWSHAMAQIPTLFVSLDTSFVTGCGLPDPVFGDQTWRPGPQHVNPAPHHPQVYVPEDPLPSWLGGHVCWTWIEEGFQGH